MADPIGGDWQSNVFSYSEDVTTPSSTPRKWPPSNEPEHHTPGATDPC